MTSLSEIDQQISQLREQLRNATSEDTSKARRNVLIASFVGIVIAITGAVPKGIEALGIKFDLPTVGLINFLVPLLLMAVIATFVYSFVVYERRDRTHRKRLSRELNRLQELQKAELLRLRRHEQIMHNYTTTISVMVSPTIAKVSRFHDYGFAISLAALSLLALLARVIFVAVKGGQPGPL